MKIVQRMPRLNLVFAGRICHLLVLLCGGSFQFLSINLLHSFEQSPKCHRNKNVSFFKFFCLKHFVNISVLRFI